MDIEAVESRQVHKVRKNRGVAKSKPLFAKQEAAPTNKIHTGTLKTTNSAELLQKLEQKLSALPIVDQNKVESIKKAINKGQYTMDPQRTAEKFVQLETALALKKSTD